jgi:hypothetical protein
MTARHKSDNVYLIQKLVLTGKPKIFRRDEARELLRSVLIYYKAQHGFRLHAYCFLPDRAMLVLAPGVRVELPRIMKDVWGNFSRRVNLRWRRKGSVLRSKYLCTELEDDPAVRRTLVWVHDQPRLQGLREPACGVPLSSAANYRRGLSDILVDLYTTRQRAAPADSWGSHVA